MRGRPWGAWPSYGESSSLREILEIKKGIQSISIERENYRHYVTIAFCHSYFYHLCPILKPFLLFIRGACSFDQGRMTRQSSSSAQFFGSTPSAEQAKGESMTSGNRYRFHCSPIGRGVGTRIASEMLEHPEM